MSTRANIVIKDSSDKLFFYRHSDGYPEGAMPTLSIFMKWLTDKKIRNNVSQVAGWLVVIGAMEYATIPAFKVTERTPFKGYTVKDTDLSSINPPADWKCGAYEPTTGIHGDIEYLYVIDVEKKEISCFEAWTEDGEGKGQPVDLSNVKA